jgi:hypothetical protein
MHQKHPPAKMAVAVALPWVTGSAAVAANATPSISPLSTAMNRDKFIRIESPLLN